MIDGASFGPGSRPTDQAPAGLDAPRVDPSRMTDHEQMLDAQAGCVPCKLCGGQAVISDAGTGAGYYIGCQNSYSFRAWQGCLIDQRRLGGWAYNVRDWWNHLHAPERPRDSDTHPEGRDAFGSVHE